MDEKEGFRKYPGRGVSLPREPQLATCPGLAGAREPGGLSSGCEGEWDPLVTLFLEETGTPCPWLEDSQLAWLGVLVDVARLLEELYPTLT